MTAPEILLRGGRVPSVSTGALLAAGVDDDDILEALAFLALPVLPELRLTDQGLVDVHRASLVNLFEEN